MPPHLVEGKKDQLITTCMVMRDDLDRAEDRWRKRRLFRRRRSQWPRVLSWLLLLAALGATAYELLWVFPRPS